MKLSRDEAERIARLFSQEPDLTSLDRVVERAIGDNSFAQLMRLRDIGCFDDRHHLAAVLCWYVSLFPDQLNGVLSRDVAGVLFDLLEQVGEKHADDLARIMSTHNRSFAKKLQSALLKWTAKTSYDLYSDDEIKHAGITMETALNECVIPKRLRSYIEEPYEDGSMTVTVGNLYEHIDTRDLGKKTVVDTNRFLRVNGLPPLRSPVDFAREERRILDEIHRSNEEERRRRQAETAETERRIREVEERLKPPVWDPATRTWAWPTGEVFHSSKPVQHEIKKGLEENKK